jgi:hypothetical protein
MAPVLAIVWMVAGVVLKRIAARPRWGRLRRFRRPGHVEFDEQSGQHRLADGGQHLTDEQYLSGSAVPSIQNQAGLPHCDQGHGRQAGALGLPHVDQGAQFYDAQHRKLQVTQLKRKAAKLGFRVVEAPAS